MKSNHGWYYSTQISLRKSHWRNPEPHSNKFQSVTFLNRVSFVNADECERIVFQDYYWDRNVRENSYRCEFQYRDDFLISYRVYMMTGSFHISLFEGTLHVDKIHVWFKIANITHALPVPVYRRTDFSHRNFCSVCVYIIPLRDFVPQRNSLPSTTTGVSPRGVTRAGMTFCGGVM